MKQTTKIKNNANASVHSMDKVIGEEGRSFAGKTFLIFLISLICGKKSVSLVLRKQSERSLDTCLHAEIKQHITENH